MGYIILKLLSYLSNTKIWSCHLSCLTLKVFRGLMVSRSNRKGSFSKTGGTCGQDVFPEAFKSPLDVQAVILPLRKLITLCFLAFGEPRMGIQGSHWQLLISNKCLKVSPVGGGASMVLLHSTWTGRKEKRMKDVREDSAERCVLRLPNFPGAVKTSANLSCILVQDLKCFMCKPQAPAPATVPAL